MNNVVYSEFVFIRSMFLPINAMQVLKDWKKKRGCAMVFVELLLNRLCLLLQLSTEHCVTSEIPSQEIELVG